MKITVFVSYSHQDAGYLKDDSLLGYLSGLKKEGVEFWSDKALLSGDRWDPEIQTRIREAHIALVLVSQMFLNSSYCTEVEITGFLEQRRQAGLIIIPIILSACDWQRHEWLTSTQFLPTGDETVEEHYTDSGRRKKLFNQILNDLRAQIERVRRDAQKTSDDTISDKGSSGPHLHPHDPTEGAEASNVTGSEANASEVTVSFEQAKTGLTSGEDRLRKELPEWVDRILSVRVEETGGFDGSVFEPSGEPSLWSTAQSLTGILSTAGRAIELDDVARGAFEFIKKAQKDDGGWAYSETLHETVTEVSCWVTVAYTAAAQAGIWKSDENGGSFTKVAERALEHILSRQSSDGGWCPTGNLVPRNTRTYSTAMALWSLARAKSTPALGIGNRLDRHITTAIRWLLDHRRDDLGWVPNPNRRHQKDKQPGLNAQVLFILTQSESTSEFLRNVPVYKDAKRQFLTDEGPWEFDFFHLTSIRDADQWLEGTDFRIEGSTFLWCPWSLAALHALCTDSELTDEERAQAGSLRGKMMKKIQECSDDIGSSGTWELAETLFCVAYALK